MNECVWSITERAETSENEPSENRDTPVFAQTMINVTKQSGCISECKFWSCDLSYIFNQSITYFTSKQVQLQ